MRQIPLGAKGSFKLLVQPEHLANRFKDAMTGVNRQCRGQAYPEDHALQRRSPRLS